MPAKLNETIILAAIDGFEAQKTRIDQQIAELRSMLPGATTAAAATTPDTARPKRKFSPAALRRMREAQQRRWAKVRGEQPASTAAAPKSAKPRKERKLSAAGRRAISEASKNRWALRRAEAAKTQAPAAKKSAPARKKAVVKKSAVRKARVAKKRATTAAPVTTETADQ